MPQAFPLQTLLELMQNRTDEASRKLGQLIVAEQNEKSRLVMLEQYREEYAQRLRDAVAQGVTQILLRNYQSFLGRIDDAITQQSKAVLKSEQNTKTGQADWQSQNIRLKAIDTLSNRHETKVRLNENKQEQKLLDEFSSRRYQKPDTTD